MDVHVSGAVALYLGVDSVSALLPFLAQADLINTAVLDQTRITSALPMIAYSTSGSRLILATDGLTCMLSEQSAPGTSDGSSSLTLTPTNAAQVAQSCVGDVFLDGYEPSGKCGAAFECATRPYWHHWHLVRCACDTVPSSSFGRDPRGSLLNAISGWYNVGDPTCSTPML